MTIKAKFYRFTIYINTTIIVLKPSDIIELSRYHLCHVIGNKGTVESGGCGH